MQLDLQQVLDFLKPDESAADFLKRLQLEQLRTGIAFLDNRICLRPGVVLELAGPHATAKSELLLQIAVNCLLYGRSDDEAKGHVIVLDLDGKFDELRLMQVLRFRIGALSSGANNAAAADGTFTTGLLQDCLARFNLMRCYSSFEYLTALLALPPLLQKLQPQPGCKLVLIDNVGAFHHIDRVVRPLNSVPQQAGMTSSSLLQPQQQQQQQQPLQPLTLQNIHAAAAARLQRLAQQYHFAVVATKSTQVAVHEPEAGPARLVHREYLPNPWQALVTHRLLLAPPSQESAAAYAARGMTQVLVQWQGQARGGQGQAQAEPVFSLWVTDAEVVGT